MMISRICPGTHRNRSTVEQYHYFREPMVTEQQIAEADAKRELYYAVTETKTSRPSCRSPMIRCAPRRRDHPIRP